MLQRYAREQHLEDAPCPGGRCQLQEWTAFVQTLRGQDRVRQLQAVNAYANRIPYRSDLDRHGVADYWATPRETFGRSADCEDYAIVKYLSLRKLGWSASELRIVVLKHEVRNELHAVLVAYVNGTAYVLDNLIPDVREHAAIAYYRPIFSINETAWHYHRDWNPASAVLVAKAEPRQPMGEGRTLPAPAAPAATAPVVSMPAAQVEAAPLPPVVDTVRVAPLAAPLAAPVAAPRKAWAPPPVRPAARSYAAKADESIAALFTNAGAQR
jgi:predicted transglutaminase-like cysteine proteinase